MAINDPEFEQKTADIIARYMDPPPPPPYSVSMRKAAIQTLDRQDSLAPLSPRSSERYGFEYYQHGALSLCVALDVGRSVILSVGQLTSL